MQIAGKEQREIMRLRRQFTFDRFLGRVFNGEIDRVMLKGGYAIELRITEARTTRDIDLCMRKSGGALPSPKELHSFFQNKAILQLGDFMTFNVLPPSRLLINAVYGGCRFAVDAAMAGRQFARFNLDVSIGDGWIDDQDHLHPRDWLAFAGVAPLDFPATTVEQQLAEKIHSYTLPRQEQNSRVKDLVDIILLTRNCRINRARMTDAVHRTFTFRKTHPLPGELSAPPAAWAKTYSALADECQLQVDLAGAFAQLKQFHKEYLWKNA
jgi:hypothetical protein